MPRFNCTERCQAPDEFYSGSPFLSNPEKGILPLRANKPSHVEWQIWTDENKYDNLTFKINGKFLNSNTGPIDGLKFDATRNNTRFYGKFMKVRATITIVDSLANMKWNISLFVNDKGNFEFVTVQILFL